MSETQAAPRPATTAGRPSLTAKLVGTGTIHNPNALSLILTVSALSVVVNVVGGTAVALLNIPFLFPDTIGTFFVAATFGIRWGALVGIITNLVLGVTSGPTAIPFLIVQVIIAVIVGWTANTIGYTWKGATLSGILVALIAPVVGTTISVLLFGGLTGHGLDLITLWLAQSGQSVFGAAFWPRLGSNVIDKILTAFIIYAVLKAVPSTLLKPRYRGTVDQLAPASAPAAPAAAAE